jgi:hypothetical protein
MRKADDAGVSPHVFDEWVRERRAEIYQAEYKGGQETGLAEVVPLKSEFYDLDYAAPAVQRPKSVISLRARLS